VIASVDDFEFRRRQLVDQLAHVFTRAKRIPSAVQKQHRDRDVGKVAITPHFRLAWRMQRIAEENEARRHRIEPALGGDLRGTTRSRGFPSACLESSSTRSVSSASSKRTRVSVVSAARLADKLGTAVRFSPSADFPQYLTRAMLEHARARHCLVIRVIVPFLR
jgi:hypothetical protein